MRGLFRNNMRGLYILLVYISSIVTLVIISLSLNKAYSQSRFSYIKEDTTTDLIIREGVLCDKAKTIEVIRQGESLASISISEPLIIAQSEVEELWGFFQFPTIYRNDEGFLVVEWQMNADSYLSYGKGKSGRMMSKDEGRTWEPIDNVTVSIGRRRLEYLNGNLLQQRTPAAIDISTFESFPAPVNNSTIDGFDFYYEHDLPEELRGVYLMCWDKYGKSTNYIHASINDPTLLRSAIKGKMPVVWWGDMRLMDDNSILAGVYGGYYPNSEGKPLRSSVSFYKSVDGGQSWNVIGKIPYKPNKDMDPDSCVFDGEDGFTEPAFEVLKDGSLLCVMRSGSTNPLYRSFSKDFGYHWTTPEPFTSNGVMPLLLTLDNGILVLASGRPGMQLRFCLDGDGKIWTEPIEMLRFIEKDGKYNEWGTTCGYPSILKVGPNGFYLVYSDFNTKNKKGESRKGIIFRKIVIERH